MQRSIKTDILHGVCEDFFYIQPFCIYLLKNIMNILTGFEVCLKLLMVTMCENGRRTY